MSVLVVIWLQSLFFLLVHGWRNVMNSISRMLLVVKKLKFSSLLLNLPNVDKVAQVVELVSLFLDECTCPPLISFLYLIHELSLLFEIDITNKCFNFQTQCDSYATILTDSFLYMIIVWNPLFWLWKKKHEKANMILMLSVCLKLFVIK